MIFFLKKKVIIGALLFVLSFFAPPIFAPIIHDGDTPNSAIRKELVKRNHRYQSFTAIIMKNGSDPVYGKRFNVLWKDFDNITGTTPTVFYVKQKKNGKYYVSSSGTAP